MARSDELRMIARVARMYHLDEMRQSEIAERIRISQASVSRLLKRAREEGIVRVSVEAPTGTYPELEERLARRFGIAECVIAECIDEREDHILSRIGEAAARYLELILAPGDVIGISSWSESLLRMVDNLDPGKRAGAARVVQILGGMGNPTVQLHATALTTRLSKLVGGEPVLLMAQGVTGTPEARAALMTETYVAATLAEFERLTMALVGIGAVLPSKMLADSGNVFTADELDELRDQGAVGDVCLHFFDADGTPTQSPFDGRVLGITLAQLRHVPRVIGVAGGSRKVAAIVGALRGGLLDVLVTDQFTAARIDAASEHDTEKKKRGSAPRSASRLDPAKGCHA